MLFFVAIIKNLSVMLSTKISTLVILDNSRVLCYSMLNKQKQGEYMSQITSNVQKVKVTCTDNGNTVDAVVDNFKRHEYMNIIMANQRIQLKYNAGYGKVYVGNAYGMEFTAYDKDIYSE